MIDLEVYLERHHSNSSGTHEVEITSLVGWVPGRGEYVTKNGKRMHIRDYETTGIDNGSVAYINSVRQVTLDFGEDTTAIIELDASGIGRMCIPPDQWLVVQDNTVLEKILPD